MPYRYKIIIQIDWWGLEQLGISLTSILVARKKYFPTPGVITLRILGGIGRPTGRPQKKFANRLAGGLTGLLAGVQSASSVDKKSVSVARLNSASVTELIRKRTAPLASRAFPQDIDRLAGFPPPKLTVRSQGKFSK